MADIIKIRPAHTNASYSNLTRSFDENLTFDDSFESDFFDTYDSIHRFCVETSLASLATVCNLVVLLAVGTAGNPCSKLRPISIYNLIFVNLSVVNVLSCVFGWVSNNLLYLFDKYFAELATRNCCAFTANIIAVALVVNALGTVGALTMVGFSIVQCVAMRTPLRLYIPSLRRGRVGLIFQPLVVYT